MATYFGFALIFFVLVMGRIFTHNDVQKERLTIALAVTVILFIAWRIFVWWAGKENYTITTGNIIYIVFVITSVAATVHYNNDYGARKCLACILMTVCFCFLCFDNFKETNRLQSIPDRYETLLAKVEDADDMTMNLVQEVSDWNMEVTEGREKEQDLSAGCIR